MRSTDRGSKCINSEKFFHKSMAANGPENQRSKGKVRYSEAATTRKKKLLWEPARIDTCKRCFTVGNIVRYEKREEGIGYYVHELHDSWTEANAPKKIAIAKTRVWIPEIITIICTVNGRSGSMDAVRDASPEFVSTVSSRSASFSSVRIVENKFEKK